MRRMLSGVALLLVISFAAGDVSARNEPMTRAIELPLQADRLRDAGVPPAEVSAVLRSMRDGKIGADEAADATEAAAKAAEMHGPVDNFGAFVQERLAAGLRGQDLATAIKAEHAAHGKKEKEKKEKKEKRDKEEKERDEEAAPGEGGHPEGGGPGKGAKNGGKKQGGGR